MSTKTVENLLLELRRRDVFVSAEGDRLRIRGPKGTLDPALQDVLKRNKADILSFLRDARRSVSSIEPVSRERPLPLSFAQERLWFLDQLDLQNPAYNMPLAARLSGKFDFEAFSHSINTIVSRHETLRTTIEVRAGHPMQVIAAELEIDLPVEDLQTMASEVRETEVEHRIQAEAIQPFELAVGPLLRGKLLRLAEREHVVLLTMHHIISDGWSMEVFFRELTSLYQEYTGGRAARLPELPVQYADYAVWQRRQLKGEVLEKQLAYWRRQLKALPALELPTDRLRPPIPSYRGASESLVISGGLLESLRAFNKREGITSFMTLLAAFKVLLYRYTGQEDVVVGTPIAGRTHQELEVLIGLFLNTLVLRTGLGGRPTFREVLGRVRDMAVEAFDHQDLPFEKLVAELDPERDPSRNPFYEVFFNYVDVAKTQMLLPSLDVKPVGTAIELTKFDLTCYVFDVHDGLSISFTYSTDLFDADTIRAMLRHYSTLLEAAITGPDCPIAELQLLGDTERRAISTAANPVQPDLPFTEFTAEAIEQTLPARFAEQVRTHGGKLAVVSPEHKWTYSDLDLRSERVAQGLLAHFGAEPVRVALLFEHGAPMVAAIIGVLKAGMVYVPLDPRSPILRLEGILSDAAVSAVVTDPDCAQLAATLGDSPAVPVIDIETFPEPVGPYPEPKASPASIAYLLYTSGSTGDPKGVVQSHRNVLQHIRAYSNGLHLTSDDRLTLLSAYIFDAAVVDIFAALLNGASLHVLNVRNDDIDALRCRLTEQQVTVYHSTPTVYRHLLADLGTGIEFSSVRVVLMGGEEVHRSDYDLYCRHFPADCLFVNGFGASEATFSLLQWLNHETSFKGSVVPVGYPVPGMEVVLLDDQGEQNDVFGEIAVVSEYVALGYWRRPELTDMKFEDAGDGTRRMYRTGDLGRRLADGSIMFLGRLDDQVKLRGLRIEPGEIETALCRHADVAETAVVMRSNQFGESGLAAYVILSPGAVFDVDDLRRQLRASLPEYMVPAIFVCVDSFPFTATGKIDRRALRALPVPEDKRQVGSRFVPPRGELQGHIAEIWREVLGIDEVGARDSFFDLGGHSLLLAQVRNRLQNLLRCEVPMVTLFQYPTVESLAEFFGGEKEQRVVLEEARARMRHRPAVSSQDGSIAVVGMTGRFPGAQSVEELWENLAGGVESIGFSSEGELQAAGIGADVLENPNFVPAGGKLEGVELFDAAFFGYTPREAELIDPQQRLFLECAWEGLERAGYDSGRFEGLIGVYAGSSRNTYLFNLLSHPDLLNLSGGGYALAGIDTDYLPMRVSYKLDLRGPSVDVQTSCSTSLVAVHEACRSLAAHECDLALAGGATVVARRAAGYVYHQDGIVSPDGHCRAFDAAGQGTVFGEGVGVVVLKRLAEALEDGDTIHAVIRGTAINNDGSNKVGFTAPNVEAQAEVIALAQASAGVDPDTIGYVEAHGTGTALGDPIEIAALDRVFGNAEPHACALGTLKSNIGHLDRAAGIAGLIKAVLALKHRQIPPSLHFSVPNPEIDFESSRFYVNTELKEWQSEGKWPLRAGVSSFGMGGTNAHAIVEEAPQVTASEPSRNEQLLVLSAKTADALEAMPERLAAYLEAHPQLPLADVAYTLQVGRREFGHRMALVCRSSGETVAALRAGAAYRGRTAQRALEVVFMFPGQGAQRVGMGAELYRQEPVFRETVDRCCEWLEPLLELDLRTVLYPEEGEAQVHAERLKQTVLTQPALFVVEYALAELWKSWGIRPQAMIGHSIGEYVAACLSGVMSLEDALGVVVERGRLMQSMPGGAMLAVMLAEEKLQGMLDERVSIAGVNGPEICVVSGPQEAIDELAQMLAEQGLEPRPLHTSHAFHSPMMEPVLEAFEQYLRGIELNAPTLPYLSNVSGDWITDEQATDPAYYARQLRSTVRFSEGLERLFSDEGRILLEVGPGRTLSGLAVGHPECPAGSAAIASLPAVTEEQCDAEAVFEALGRLWVAGVAPDWSALHGDARRRRVELPTYPFERERFWIEALPGRVEERGNGAIKKPDIADWFYVPSWQQTSLPDAITQAPALEESGSWLLFADDLGLADALRNRLLEAKQRVSVVRLGDEFIVGDEDTYTLRALEPAHYDSLIETLEARGCIPERIVHLWGVTVAGAYASDALVDRCFYSPMHLVQAMGRRELGGKVQLTLVSNDMQNVAGDEALCPEKATAMGPCRVIPFEYPNVACRSVDLRLPNGETTEKDLPVEALVAELLSELADPVVAYRDGYRWVPTYEQVRLEPREAKPVRLRERGVYLITGGLGGIGLTLARYLARAVAARLVLVGRTGLPPIPEWEAWLAGHGENDTTSRRIRAVRALEADGAEVMVASADVAERAQMQDLMEAVRRRFGHIHGVIHSAGIAGGGLIQLKTRETAAAVLAPKVAGTLVLNELLRDLAPDFMLLCSSRTALNGVPGQIDYTAANAFLDAFASQRQKISAAYTVSVNWPAWSEVGMAVETEVPDDLAAPRVEQLAMGIRPNEGTEVFQRILGSDFARVIVSNRPFDVPAPGSASSAEGEAPEAEAGEAEVVPRAGHARPSLATKYVAVSSELERRIARIWGELFGIDRIGIHDNFFDLGGHSLLALQLRAKLEEALGVEVPAVTLFQYPTVESLARRFSGELEERGLLEEARARVERRGAEKAGTHGIAIIGMAGRFPGAPDLERFWSNLREGVESIRFFNEGELRAAGVDESLLSNPSFVPAWGVVDDAELFDASFFGYAPREAVLTDPQQRVFLECASDALEDAGYDPARYPGLIGVYAGSGRSNYLTAQSAIQPADAALLLATSSQAYLPTRVSYKLNLLGPSLYVQTACSTSLVAVHEACRALIDQECDMVLAGGVSITAPRASGYLYHEQGITSPDGHCRAFDANAQGTVWGEGVGIVVLKRLEDALADGDEIHAVIRGTAINNDGSDKVGFTAPSVEGQAGAIALAQADAGVEPGSISYLETHGTGTALGDPIEITALSRVFGARGTEKARCALGALKTNIGHLDAAAGVAGLIKTVLALEHRELPPTMHFRKPNPEIDFDNTPFFVNAELRAWESPAGEPRRAGVSSFGIGGTNAHAIVEEAPEVTAFEPSREEQLLVLSAKTGTALEAMAERLSEHLEAHPQLPLADVAYTLQVGRRQFGQRRALVSGSSEEAVAALRAGAGWTGRSSEKAPEVVFMFPGQGSQHVGMGRGFYESEEVYREAVDRCCEQLEPRLGLDLRKVLYPQEGEAEASTERLKQTALTQPALFVVEYALAELWKSWGIRPQAMIGHSIGEYVAACLSGVMSLADALGVVAQRGRLMQSMPPGAMLAVACVPEELEPLLAEGVGIAALNEPGMSVVSGPFDAVEALESSLAAEQVHCQRLHTSHAFHSAMMEPVLEPFAQLVGRIELKAPEIPFISNLSGTWITAEQAIDPNYWAQHLRQTVRFGGGMEELLKTPNRVLLEVGPGNVLSTLASHQPGGETEHGCIASMRHPRNEQPDLVALLNALGRLWLAGVEVDWGAYYGTERRRRVPLPTYPFERKRFWIEAGAMAASRSPAFRTGAAAKIKDVEQWCYVPVWKSSLSFDAVARDDGSLQGAWLIFTDEGGFGERIATGIEQRGGEVIRVGASEAFARRADGRYGIDPACREDYDRLLEAAELGGAAPGYVVHAWSLGAAQDDAPDGALERGFYSILFLTQAVMKRWPGARVHMDVLTEGAVCVGTGDIPVPARAPALGLCNVIRQELASISCRSIDLAVPKGSGADEDRVLRSLLGELGGGDSAPVAAYRNHRRWVQTFEQVPLKEHAGKSRLREHGVYLITGGVGGVGLALAAHLAKAVKARLILTQRSELPHRDAWEQWLSSHDEHDRTSRKIRGILALEELGADVMLASVDVANRADMGRLVTAATERFGAVHGVIHAAGVLDRPSFKSIETLTLEDCERQFHPKLRGLMVLQELFHDRPLDFMMPTSSLSSVLGGLGYAAYAAGNQFMDALCHRQHAQGNVHWLSINWDGWRLKEQGVESAVDGSVAVLAMTPAEGRDVFDRVMRLGMLPQVLVSTGDLSVRLAQWVMPRSSEEAGAVVPARRHERPQLSTEHVAPANEIEQELAEIWQDLFSIEKIGTRDNFFDLGGHSLLAMQVLSRVRDRFDVSVKIEEFLELGNIEKFAARLEAERWVAQGRKGVEPGEDERYEFEV